MRLDLVVHDCNGKTRGYVQLKLELGRGTWSVEEDAQRAWRNTGFSDSGPFEVMDDDVIWLWEQEIGNAKQNTAVLTGLATDAAGSGRAGSGRIVTGQVGRFNGGTIRWTISEAPQRITPAATLQLVASRAASAGSLAEMPAY